MTTWTITQKGRRLYQDWAGAGSDSYHVLRRLADSGNSSTEDLAATLGKGIPEADRHLRRMAQRTGTIRRVEIDNFDVESSGDASN